MLRMFVLTLLLSVMPTGAFANPDPLANYAQEQLDVALTTGVVAVLTLTNTFSFHSLYRAGNRSKFVKAGLLGNFMAFMVSSTSFLATGLNWFVNGSDFT